MNNPLTSFVATLACGQSVTVPTRVCGEKSLKLDAHINSGGTATTTTTTATTTRPQVLTISIPVNPHVKIPFYYSRF